MINVVAESFSKRSVVLGQKILISKRVCVMGWDNFLKGVQAIFGENRKSHTVIAV